MLARLGYLAGVTTNPTEAWKVQQARNLVMDLGESIDELRLLMYDRDTLFTSAFRQVFTAERRNAPSREVAELDDLRSIQRKPVVAGMSSEYHHAA